MTPMRPLKSANLNHSSVIIERIKRQENGNHVIKKDLFVSRTNSIFRPDSSTTSSLKCLTRRSGPRRGNCIAVRGSFATCAVGWVEHAAST
jgi:hypothetical protein